MTRREASKLETRTRVLNAARTLFEEFGYTNTTVRMIAERAGVAPGSVFTTFASKEEVLSVIVLDRYVDLSTAIEEIFARGAETSRQMLKLCFAAGYEFEFKRLPMIVEQIGASWTWSKDFEKVSQAGLVQPFAFIAKIINQAVTRGELAQGLDQNLLCDMVLGVYLRNFRHAWYRELTIKQVLELSQSQIDLLFDGARPG